MTSGPKPGTAQAAKPGAPPTKAAPPKEPALELTRDERAWYAHELALAILANEAREETGLEPLPLLTPAAVRLEKKMRLDAARAAAAEERERPTEVEPPAYEAVELNVVEEAAPAPAAAEGADAAPAPAPAAKPKVPDRVRTKLKLWRLRTLIEVEVNAADGETMAWRDSSLALERGDKRVGSTEATELARGAVALPADCGEPDAALRDSGGIPCWEVTWVHLVGPDGDVVVEGDKILVRVNATTGKVHSVFKKWRQVPPTPPAGD